MIDFYFSYISCQRGLYSVVCRNEKERFISFNIMLVNLIFMSIQCDLFSKYNKAQHLKRRSIIYERQLP